MRRLSLLILLIYLLLTFSSCNLDTVNVPIGESMTKWESGDFELYVGDSFDRCTLVHTCNDIVTLFNVRGLYGHMLLICVRAESNDGDMTPVATYYETLSLDDEYYKYELNEILNLKFVSFFPKELKFKCVDFSLTEQEVPFEWQSFTSSQAIKIYDEIKK